MKKLVALLLCLTLLLVGCSSNTEPVLTPPFAEPIQNIPESTEDVAISKELLAVSVPVTTECFNHEDGTELFSYTAQHMQLIFPDAEVADKVVLDFLNRVDASREDAESIFGAAKLDYDSNTTWFPYFYQMIYDPMRIDHSVMSLFGTMNSYSGGMHGSKSCIAANYDMMTGDVLTLGSIMHADASKEDFIKLILDKLIEIAEDRYLYEDYETGVRNRLEGDENLYEDFYFTTTGLDFFFSPYEIAPYSSGVITVEIPYSELPGLIYDGYFPEEREQISGSMHTGSFMLTDMEQFNNMAEVNLVSGEEIMVAYPDGNVEDVRIVIPGDGMNMPDYTVFAAFEMSDKDAIVISLAKDMIDGIAITYSSADTSVTIPLAE